jgi:uncharacterized membrane protein
MLLFIFSFPMLLLAVLAAVVFLGFLERVLERMRLSRREALILLLVMLAASFIPDLSLYRGLQVNIGGALVPLGIVIYLLWTTDTSKERLRGVASILVVTAAVYVLDKFLPLEPGFISFDLDPLYLPALFAAVFAYLTGRSRRSAFIGAVGGVLLLDIVAWVENLFMFPGVVPVVLGGGGVLGGAVVAGVLAVFLAEIVGELRERLERGPA